MTTTSSSLGSATAESRPAGMTRVGALPWVLAVSLVLTGASGLMYQVVWFRALGQVFGVTVQATSAVLAAYMAGLAAGSLLAARLSPRLTQPVRFYGVAEVVIGVAGLLSLPAFDALQPLYGGLAAAGDGPVLVVGRFVLAFFIMLVPTTLMGATLPIVITATERRAPALARNVGLLYGANTFGAIVGAFAAGFYLIGLFGLTVTVAIAATLNIAIGLLWIVLSYGSMREPGRSDHPTASAAIAGVERAAPLVDDAVVPVSRRVGRIVLLAYAMSGAVALGAEVVWTRILAGIFPGTTYSFSIMLCATLTGIALGSWAMTPLVGRRANWLLVFVGLQLALGAAALLSVFTLGQAYAIDSALRGVLGGGDSLFQLPLFRAGFAALVILPSALLMGAAFPVAARVYAGGQPDPGRRVGLVYGINTLGAIGGALGAGLVLIPLVGAQYALWILAGGNALAGLAVLVASEARVALKAGAVVASAGAALAMVVVTPSLYQQLYGTNPRGETTIWAREGQDSTVRVVSHPDGVRILYIDSEHQGADGGEAAAFHQLIGHWGSLMHPNALEVLVVGLGVGATPGAAALHQQANITLLELHPGVVDAAPFFERANFDVLQRPNVSTRVTDGRNFLMTTDRRFDVIQADPIRPTNAGAGNLYSADFFRMAREHLTDDGVMVQWVDNTLPNYSYRLLLRTFQSVFPESTLWHYGSVIVGSKRPLELNQAALERAFADPAVAASLAHLGMARPADVAREFTAGPEAIRAYAGDGPINTDRTPWLEFFWTLPLASDATVRPAGWSPPGG